MRKPLLLTGITLLALTVSVAAEEPPPIAGNYKKLAACVYRVLDGDRPGAFRLTDLGDEINVFTMIPAPAGDGVMLQTNKATFRKIAENSTAVVVEKDTKGMFDLRNIVTNCAAK
jgi:hypothetical protein